MIVITTPTGDIGHQLVKDLLARGAKLRLIARDPAKLSAEVRERVEVVQGSHGDADVVNRAFAGADAVFWLAPPDPRNESLDATYIEFTRPACEAFTRHGVKRVVGVSALGRGTPLERQAGLVTVSLEMDDLIGASGVAYRALCMPSFMDNLLRQVELIKAQGMFAGPLSPDKKHPTCATRDIASAAAALLLDDGWTGVDEVPVLGPEDLSPDDQAAILTEVLGRPIRYQQVPMDAFEARLKGTGMSDAMLAAYMAMMTAKEAGLDDAAPRAKAASTPTSFRQWAEEVLKPRVTGG